MLLCISWNNGFLLNDNELLSWQKFLMLNAIKTTFARHYWKAFNIIALIVLTVNTFRVFFQFKLTPEELTGDINCNILVFKNTFFKSQYIFPI